jgi:hypothetical protein
MRISRFYLVVFSLLAVAPLLVAPSLIGQTVSASISGLVTDPTGAAVPGASVVLRNANTGLVVTTTTGAQGLYAFPIVPVGTDYTVTVTAEGFKTYVNRGITLLVNQAMRVDAQLALGSTHQAVEVSAQAVQVATQSNALGDVIESQKMTALPLNGRSYIDLLGLQPGVVPETTQGGLADRPVAGMGSAGNYSVNGGRETGNGFMLNGGSVEEGRNNGAGLVPNLDSIQEFKLITNASSAEYGHYDGALVNVVTKSGTNQWHGEVFEFLRNDVFDSRNFFNATRGAFKQNQFGGTLGGPIIKDRLFIFSDYQGTRLSEGLSSGLVVVPTMAERQGNESALISPTSVVKGCDTGDAGCLNQQLSQSLGYPVANGEPYYTPSCTSTSQCVFPGGIIPQSAWSPAAAKLLQFIPTPTPGLGGAAFETSAYNETERDDKWSTRLDLNTQKSGNWSMFYTYDSTYLVNPYPQGNNLPGFDAATPQVAMQAVLENTKTIGPRNVNEAHLIFFRTGMTEGLPTQGLGSLSSFGFQQGGNYGINPLPSVEGVPIIGLGILGIQFGVPALTTGQYDNTYQGLDDYTMVRGKHTIKFGGDYARFQINERNDADANGSFSFEGGETGSDFADFLLGAPDGYNQQARQYLDSRSENGALYAEDSFRAKPNLTLNYGLRWEFSTFFRDKLDRVPANCRIQTIKLGEQSTIYPTAPEGWLCPGDPGVASGLAPNDYHSIAPRLGLAYSPGFSSGLGAKLFGGPGKTSIRASYGMYYTDVEDLTMFYEVGDVPAGLDWVSPVLVYLSEPFKARRAAGGPGQKFPFPGPNPATINWAALQPVAGSNGFDVQDVLPYEQQYDFSIQRQLGSSSILTLAYVGTNGHHLIVSAGNNPGSASVCLATPGCGPFGENTIYTLPNGQFQYGTGPYSVTSGRYLSQGVLDFNTDEGLYSTIGNSDYNALQVSLEKRVGAVTFVGAYTFSKSIDDSSGISDSLDPLNHRLSIALSGFDTTNNFVFSYNWRLPFAKLAPSSRVAKALLGDWQLSGITRFMTGFPVLMGESNDYSLCGCSGEDYPNWNDQPIQKFNPRTAPNNQYFSTAPFSSEVLGVPGDSSPRFFHGPGLNNFDIAVHKLFALRENMRLEYRAEFFNAFNHAQFNTPSGTYNASTFGDVTSAADPRIIQMALRLTF